MAEENCEEENDASDKTILVRGADGALYALSPADLAPFKLSDAKAESVTDILEDADKNPEVAPLPNDVVEAIRAAGGCVKTGAVSPQVFTNTSTPPETSS